MINVKSVYVMTGLLIFTATIGGCATYEKCGPEDCTRDTKITADVRAAFDQHPELEDPDSIGVHTQNNVVFLDGFVINDFDRATAESVARDTPDVTRVVSGIVVTE